MNAGVFLYKLYELLMHQRDRNDFNRMLCHHVLATKTNGAKVASSTVVLSTSYIDVHDTINDEST